MLEDHLTFFLVVPSITKCGILKSSVIIAVSPISSVNVCFTYLGTLMLGAFIVTSIVSSW